MEIPKSCMLNADSPMAIIRSQRQPLSGENHSQVLRTRILYLPACQGKQE